MKSIGIAHIHLRKMPLKFWGIVPTPSGPWGLRSDGHHGQGVFIKIAGTKKSRRNLIWATKEFKGGGA